MKKDIDFTETIVHGGLEFFPLPQSSSLPSQVHCPIQEAGGEGAQIGLSVVWTGFPVHWNETVTPARLFGRMPIVHWQRVQVKVSPCPILLSSRLAARLEISALCVPIPGYDTPVYQRLLYIFLFLELSRSARVSRVHNATVRKADPAPPLAWSSSAKRVRRTFGMRVFLCIPRTLEKKGEIVKLTIVSRYLRGFSVEGGLELESSLESGGIFRKI